MDTLTGQLAVSLNGGPPITRTLKNLTTKKPQKLRDKLVLGLSNSSSPLVENNQFLGSVTGVNIFQQSNDRDIERMSRDMSVDGDVMAWSSLKFVLKEIRPVIRNEDIYESPDQTYNLTLPVDILWQEAQHFCRVLGRMTRISSQEELDITARYVKETRSSCSNVWMPISDEAEEGVYRSTNDGTRETFLQWVDGDPNGAEAQNNVYLKTALKGFVDISQGYPYCTLCTINSSKTMTLRGLCRDSLIGKNLPLIISSLKQVFRHGLCSH